MTRYPYRPYRPSKAQTLILLCVLIILSSGFKCTGTTTKNLAVASQAISHALLDAQTASMQAVTQGVISQADDNQFELLLSKAAQTGLVLDQGIRAGESATSISAKVNVFLDAFNQLNTTGVAGIKNPNLKLTISTILNGAEASVAVIAAVVGTGAGSGTQATGASSKGVM